MRGRLLTIWRLNQKARPKFTLGDKIIKDVSLYLIKKILTIYLMGRRNKNRRERKSMT